MTEQSPFMRLPEIRLRIYEYVFHRFELFQTPKGAIYAIGVPDSVPANAICRVNHKIRAETIPGLERQTKALISHYQGPQKLMLGSAFFDNIQILVLQPDKKDVAGHRLFRSLKAIVVADTLLWGKQELALPTKRIMRDQVGTPHSNALNTWLGQISNGAHHQVKVWVRLIFVGSDADQESFAKLCEENKLIVESSWWEVSL